ncbi:uncharacterized protein LOC124359039 [Homalodisca vitripennis]|uniref:uncharacterized protein LOC124359038 n=1 Tax=Homalodisca vitripennis TaxID=197043 RepID=UPI001EEBBB5B|nr:uncharacterized protein LOC124359038 [Homalodisca vitripennis]XP_046667356.1 uncharacterized protein LOC124359039 [Homalodisca vitripennis]
MVRNYIKKKVGPEINERDVEEAVKLVLEKNVPIRQAAESFGLVHTMLFYRIKKAKALLKTNLPSEHTDIRVPSAPAPLLTFNSKYTSNQVFSAQEEKMLEEYIITCSAMNYGLTYKIIRALAFQYAEKLGRCPKKWEDNKTAGLDWLKGFMKRHKDLSLRKPENTSLARTLGFNRKNIEEFQKNLDDVYKKHKFSPSDIYNLDETGIKTVVQAPNVVAKKGTKQVGQVVSGERGSLITMVATVNAAGNTIPPVFIFPRARLHDSLMVGAISGSLGFVNSPTSGWITNALFLKVLEHFVKYSHCSKESPVLLILDNHESHCTLDAILYARDNGICIVTIPPHCSHRVQPLDVSILGPFKQNLATVQNNWLTNNPGSKLSIHDLAGLASKAFNLAFTRKNILKGFEECGIWPYSTTVFTDEDFPFSEAMITSSTPTPDTTKSSNLGRENENYSQGTSNARPTGSTSIENESLNDGILNKTVAVSPSPEVVRPYPQLQAKSSVECKKGREPGKSKIITATPEKIRLEEEIKRKLLEKQKKEELRKQRDIKAKRKLDLPEKNKKSGHNKRRKTNKHKSISYESDCDDPDPIYMESGESDWVESSEEDDNFDRPNLSKQVKICPMLEKYYAVFYDISWYLGRVVDFPDEGFSKIKFLKEGLGDSYEWPKHDDVQVIENKYLFYGPVPLIGNGPFLIDDKCKRRIRSKYSMLKK